jgi:ribosome recycling factor
VDEVQKATDKLNKVVEEMLEKKENDIMTV